MKILKVVYMNDADFVENDGIDEIEGMREIAKELPDCFDFKEEGDEYTLIIKRTPTDDEDKQLEHLV